MLHGLTLAALFLSVGGTATGNHSVQQPGDSSARTRRVVVTVMGKTGSALAMKAEDFELQVGRQKLQPSRLYSPGELPTVLAIVLPENLDREFDHYLPALRDFVLHRPPRTYVGFVYLSDRSEWDDFNFFLQLDRVADSLRPPAGDWQLGPASTYTSITELLTRMAALPPARIQVLLFGSGEDVSHRVPNPRLDGAIVAAQEVGATVWAIHARTLSDPDGKPDAPVVTVQTTVSGRNMAEVIANAEREAQFEAARVSQQFRSGLELLRELARRTGGRVLAESPEDLRVVLEEFQRLLERQYVLEFEGTEPPRRVRLNRKVDGVELLVPRR